MKCRIVWTAERPPPKGCWGQFVKYLARNLWRQVCAWRHTVAMDNPSPITVTHRLQVFQSTQTMSVQGVMVGRVVTTVITETWTFLWHSSGTQANSDEEPATLPKATLPQATLTEVTLTDEAQGCQSATDMLIISHVHQPISPRSHP